MAVIEIGLIIGLITFLHSEHWFCNRSPRRELLFWYTVSCLLSGYYVFYPIHTYTGSLALALICFSCTLCLCGYQVQSVIRARLTRYPNASTPSTVSRDKLQHLLGLIRDLSSPLRVLGGYANKSRDDTLKIEAEILDIFDTMPSHELNDVLKSVNVSVLIRDMRNHVTKGRQQHRLELLECLMIDRILDVDIVGRAILVDAMQKATLSHEVDRFIVSVFTSTEGPDLTLLKRLIDHGGDYHDMIKLVYHDLGVSHRETVLTHIRLNTFPDTSLVKIISDIDDTLSCQLMDKRYPRNTVYPGVRGVYEALDVGMGNLVFLTARPGGYRGVVEDITYRMLDRAELHTTPLILAGSFAHFIGNKSMAKKKLQNFQMYQSVNPEYEFVFIGDSGQGDVSFALEILDQHSSVALVLIHDVKFTPEEERQKLRDQGVYFFDTYIGAGVIAFTKGLVKRQQLLNIVESTRVEFINLKLTDKYRLPRMAELNRDIEAVMEVLDYRTIPLIE